MKKFIFSIVAMLMMAVATVSAQSQSNYAGSSKLTDNVSVTLQGGVLTTFTDFYAGHTAMAPIAVLGVEKYVTPAFGIGVEGRTLVGTGTVNEARFNSHTVFDAVNVNLYSKVNLVNLFDFDGTRKVFEPVVYTGLGWGHQTCSSMVPRNYVTYRAGLELNFNVSKNRAWGVVVNPSVVWGDIDNGKLIKQHGNFEVTAGVVYHLKTSNGTRSIAKAKLYDQAEVDALNARIAALEGAPAKIVERVVEVPATNAVVVPSTYFVSFGFDSAELTDETKEVLDKVAGVVNVVAYASPEGTADYNKALSERRAEAVAEYLRAKGVTVEDVTGLGATAVNGRVAIVTVK